MSARTICQLLSVVLFLVAWVDVSAQRRSIRVDGFGTWDEFVIPSAGCPGTVAQSTLVQRNGHIFSGRENVAHLFDTYCQVPQPGTLNQASYFYADETALATMFGNNPGDRVTAIRYSFFDRGRFDFTIPPSGFQWVFYSFPSGGRIVGLYGLASTTLTETSYILRGTTRVWDASRDGYTGQYFCFDNDVYVGSWNGNINSTSECVRIGFRLFRGTFE